MNSKPLRHRALVGAAAALFFGAQAGATAVPIAAPAPPVVAQIVTVAPPASAPAAIGPVVAVSAAAPQVLLVLALPAPGAPAMPAAAAARSAPSGWSDSEVGAARVRNLQTMMMVGALRCRSIGVDVLTDYNGFVTSARETLVAVNDSIKARLIATFGKAMGEERYDAFTTTLANAFGADATTPGTCQALRGIVRRAAEGATSRATLLQIADTAHLDSGLPTLVPASVEMAAR